MTSANPHRGEAVLVVAGETHVLRPSFTALVAAEEELGPLFALVERASEGQLRLAEIAALFWHCLAERDGLSREAVGEAVIEQGLAACAKPLIGLVGGIGSVYGAVAGGFVVGIAANMALVVLPSGYSPSVPFLLILAVLILRPNGLFGVART